MEKVNWKVEGMTCSNCALSVNKVLTRQGMKDVAVNAITGDVAFNTTDTNGSLEKAKKNIEDLGYTIVADHLAPVEKKKKFLDTTWKKFVFCLPFTLVLMAGHLGMWAGIHFLHNPYLQLALCLPVYIVGMDFFGKSALRSLRSGVPNMNVLIAIGATAAFIYSIIGTITNDPSKIFYETAASILTIVFFGNWLEDFSIEKTQKSINDLTKHQVVMANMIAYDDQHNENIFPIENTHLKVGDLILVKAGEQVPMDCKVLTGEAEVNEAIISGESLPVFKKQNDVLIGGSVIANGTIKAYVTAVGKDTVLNGIVDMMKRAQGHKPPVQQLADKISGIFVPVVLSIAVLTIAGNYFLAEHSFQESLMRSIAVLVIACPCAMGLATPAAIAVGLGRAARQGILYTDSKSMELFRTVKQMVFDKTGTLTTGQFKVSAYKHLEGDEESFRRLVYSLEKFSNHPIAKSISSQWKTTDPLKWKKIEELRGLGMQGQDKEGNTFMIGSGKIHPAIASDEHQLYVVKNGAVIGWLDIADEIRPEAAEVMAFCRKHQIRTILLSGDTPDKCKAVAEQLNIDEVYAGQTPQQKLEKIDQLSSVAPTVMVGDGINDAPALARASISVSLSAASQLAIQSASVVLMNNGLKKLPMAMQLGKHTYGTVKSNLFWAFLYNIIAIPIAAVGLLTPTAGALVMGLSDVVLAGNSLWLNWKKLD
ncbi:cadmium-translocating P-type ATPase [Segetibacter sp. 3557_3]|uniref:heavy metal translocating P-type ATPase n=1 Tax=Segetibacter sp. 3557_3 TaxID=2547429 RepID=UPI001058ADC4|nr:cation-translocating P-type ATPase [Segetibacter sp. 3557_3]TDH19838.1 cadmium-translocating P-type ATPase [Segetibacter sp. 3557_3]